MKAKQKPMHTTIVPTAFTGQSVEEYFKKLLSERGPFAQLEIKLWEYKQKFETTTEPGKFATSPINELKVMFYKYITDKVHSFVENLSISLLPDQIDGVPGYLQTTIAMRNLAKRFEDLEANKPWKKFPESDDEIVEIKKSLNEISTLVDNLKQSIGGGWSNYC